MRLKAIFDNVDSAEHALFQLNSMGLEPRGYQIRRMDGHGQSEGGAYPEGFYGDRGAAAIQFSGLTGGVWNAAGWNNGVGMDEITSNQFHDGVSRDVQLMLECSDEEGERIKGALVSLHGRQVRVDR